MFIIDVYDQGWSAYWEGSSYNPYFGLMALEWEEGWDDARDEDEEDNQ